MVKQTIRENVFETNSSSYHSLSILTKEDDYINDLPRGGMYTLDLSQCRMINENTTCMHKTEIDKLKALVNFLSYIIQDQAEEAARKDGLTRDPISHTEEKPNPNFDEGRPEGWNNQKVIRNLIIDDEGVYFFNLSNQLKNQLYAQTAILSALQTAVSKVCKLSYIGEPSGNGFDESEKEVIIMLQAINSSIKDLKSKEDLAICFEDIIFNKDIILKHKCDSNE